MQKFILSLIFFAATLLFERAFSANDIKKEPNGILKLPTETQEAEVRRLDTELSKKVHDMVSNEWSSKGYKYLGVKVNNGVVNLTGLVQTENDRKRLEARIKNIIGVRALKSDIRIIQIEEESRDIDSEDDQHDIQVDENMNEKH